METTYRTAMNAVVGLVFVTGIALTAYLIAISWGGLYWLFDVYVADRASGRGGLHRGDHRKHPRLAGRRGAREHPAGGRTGPVT